MPPKENIPYGFRFNHALFIAMAPVQFCLWFVGVALLRSLGFSVLPLVVWHVGIALCMAAVSGMHRERFLTALGDRLTDNRPLHCQLETALQRGLMGYRLSPQKTANLNRQDPLTQEALQLTERFLGASHRYALLCAIELAVILVAAVLLILLPTS